MLFPTQCSIVALRRPFIASRFSHQCLPRLLTRPKSLSAIHRGLRESERAQYGETHLPPTSMNRPRRSDTIERPRRRTPPSRSRRDDFEQKFSARAVDSSGPNWRQQQQLRKKLAKKKAKEEERELEDGRQTRRKRFTDPEASFAKKSLVYRLKHGDLKNTAEQLPLEEPVKPRSFRSVQRGSRFGSPEHRSLPGGEERWTERRTFDNEPRGRPRDNERMPVRRGYGGDRTRPRQDVRRPEPGVFGDEVHGDEFPAARGRKKEMMNMTIDYTTAASQFLYGRNVVKAALEQGRRQLYKLYIYGGENRRDSKDNTTMTRLAQKHGIPITIVPNGEQRIMDKMSMGRPHNGFVLETSPLPQLPIKSLGKLEETPSRLGFHVELEFQTKEEETINGTDTFIRRASDFTPKPFVLLLNEILDPGNLGGILRTASYLGVDAVGITNRGSSTLTPVVLKSAAGAVEEITLFTVDDAQIFIEESGKAGWKTFAAVAPPDRKLVKRHGHKFISAEAIEARSPLNRDPCILVLGNEGHGLPKELKVAADYELSIPRFAQKSCVDSLNVSVAAGLLCHSFVKEPQVIQKQFPHMEELVEEEEMLDEIKQVETEQEANHEDVISKENLSQEVKADEVKSAKDVLQEVSKEDIQSEHVKGTKQDQDSTREQLKPEDKSSEQKKSEKEAETMF